MDPELEKMIIAAQAAGLDDEAITHLVDRWHADHPAARPPTAAPAEATAARARPAPAPAPRPTRGYTMRDLVTAGRAFMPGVAGIPSPSDVKHLISETGPELTSAAQVVPGARALEAGAVKLATGKPYREAVGDVDRYANVPVSHRVAGQAMAGLPLAMIPGNPAVVGALLGGAQEALNADDPFTAEGWQNRLAKTAGGAAVGGTLGHVLDVGGTAVQSKLSPSYDKAAYKFGDIAKDVNAKNYGRALGQVGPEPPPQFNNLFSKPRWKELEADLRLSPEFETMDRANPQFIDEMFKSLSDEAGAVQKGLEPRTTKASRPNSKRRTLGDVRYMKDELMNAISEPGVKPPITFDVPAETHTVEPRITPERETLQGAPMPGPLNTYSSNETTLGQLARHRFAGEHPGRPGPAGPAFQLRGRAQEVKPGVEVNTPAMRVETAPAQDVPAYMPFYRPAVKKAAEQAREMEALDLGYQTLPSRVGKMQPNPQNAKRYGEEGVNRFFNRPEKLVADEAADAGESAADAAAREVPMTTPAQRERFVSGVQASVKRNPLTSKVLGIPVWASPYVRQAPGLIREAGATPTFADMLAKSLSTSTPNALFGTAFGPDE